MKNIQVETINIDDKKYVVLDKISNEGVTYYYLSNVDDSKDMMVNKVVDGSDIATDLDSEEEIQLAMNLYLTKLNKSIN